MHVIHLRKPWSILMDHDQWTRSVDVPDLDQVRAEIRASRRTYFRSFNATPGLLASHVKMRITEWSGDLEEVSLNQHSIEFYPSENREVVVDVTQFLQTRNELRIALLNLEGVSPQLTGEVFLEVEDVG